MAEDSLHLDILGDNIHDALGNPGCCYWAAGIQEQSANLGVTFPFSRGRAHKIDHLVFRKPGYVCLGGAAHFASWCSLSMCQALHLFVVICMTGLN